MVQLRAAEATGPRLATDHAAEGGRLETWKGSVPDKTEVHAQAPVLAATLEAHKDSIADAGPLWVLR